MSTVGSSAGGGRDRGRDHRGRTPAVLRGAARTARGARGRGARRRGVSRSVAVGVRGPQGARDRPAAGREAGAARTRDAQCGPGLRLAAQRGGECPLRRARPAALDAGLAAVPRRIHCFDISTIQGSDTVASMVVCEQGRMRRSEYRKFRIHAPAADGGPDDFAAIDEVVQRRYAHVADEDGPWPDLIRDRRGRWAAVGGLRGARAPWSGAPGGGGAREEGRAHRHARPTRPDRVAAPTVRRCCCCSGSATRRTGSPSRSTGRRAPCATCSGARRHSGHWLAEAEAAADPLRVGGRRAPRGARGPRGGGGRARSRLLVQWFDHAKA